MFCRICRQTGHKASGCTGKKTCNFYGGEGHTYYRCPKSDRPKTYAAAAAGPPAPKTTRPKLDPTANAKVNALLKASQEEAQQKPELPRRSNPIGLGPKDQKSPGPGPEEIKSEPIVEPTTVVDPAPPPESAASAPDSSPSQSKRKEKAQKPQEDSGQQQGRGGGDRGGLETGEVPEAAGQTQVEPQEEEETERDEEVDQNLPKPGRKRQRQRKEDFYTTKKKLISSQAEQQNDGYITIDSDEDDIEDTGGTPGEQNLALQTELQELHQQLALIDVTGSPSGKTQWMEVPEAIAEILILEDDEGKV
ncbi:hypothetical protein NDU88_001857 [Pleurodeles waltl]|uniref:Uncharacterized protein n=1 Tax=Pleurodeles waltl TaxID=8319 RepID=A0AAV7T1J0_PLEWA|nr:hypothetical protein NDU88_001857 [Pleurodeles waltl]